MTCTFGEVLEKCQLVSGGTAVGTGLNTPKGFDVDIAAKISEITGADISSCWLFVSCSEIAV